MYRKQQIKYNKIIYVFKIIVDKQMINMEKVLNN